MKIDFVMPWVDGGDPQWSGLKRRYEELESRVSRDADANGSCRYRDTGLLKYWFRSVERFAPWVDRVFFVTCGQKPQWLDESNPKLRLVSHSDYIPEDCLPTFHSNTIELNLHRIKDLSEHFVLFNDDVFMLRPLDPDFFFRDGLPVIPCDLGVPNWLGCSNVSRIAINNAGVLKLGLDVNRLVRRNMRKFVDVRALGFVRAVKNAVSFYVNRIVIPGTFGHLSHPHLKSTFEEIWRAQPHVLERTSRSRFRSDDSVNHWLASAWNMVSGRFCPVNEKRNGAFVDLAEESLPRICDIVRNQRFPQICLSDKGDEDKMDRCFAAIAVEMDRLLPEKSSFEK